MNTKTTVSVAQAREEFAEILNRVSYMGEVITIAKYNKPMVKIIPALRPLPANIISKYFGMWKGKSWAEAVGKGSRSFRTNRVTV